MIYLATPYSHPDHAVMEARFDAACRFAGAMMAHGEVVFSPIAHTHPIAVRCSLPRGWEYWCRYDREMLEAAEKLCVVMMDGWRESNGVAADIAMAEYMGKPVEYLPYAETGEAPEEST